MTYFNQLGNGHASIRFWGMQAPELEVTKKHSTWQILERQAADKADKEEEERCGTFELDISAMDAAHFALSKNPDVRSIGKTILRNGWGTEVEIPVEDAVHFALSEDPDVRAFGEDTLRILWDIEALPKAV